MMGFSPPGWEKNPTDIQCFGIDLIYKHLRQFQLMSAPVETVTRAVYLQAYAEPPHFDGAHRDHDYYLARAASLRCLETCFPKETTEGQLLSAQLSRLLSMCVLAAFL